MTISFTPEKIEKILHMVGHFLDAEFITIRIVESCIGRLASSFPGVQFGPLYYRNVKICKARHCIVPGVILMLLLPLLPKPSQN